MSLFQSGDGRVGSLARFFGRRARRILPPYYACLAISLYVAITITSKQTGMPFEQYMPVTSDSIWAHVLLIHNFKPDWMYKINGVLWSISAEAQLYLLFPILVWLVARFGRNLTMIVAGLASYAILVEFPVSIKLYVWYIALFALGIASAHAAYRPVVKIGVRPNTAYGLCVIAFALCLFGIGSNWAIPITDAFIALGCCCLMYAGSAAPEGILPRFLGSRPLAALGAISYSLYLMHHPIQQVVYAYRPAWAQDETGIFLYLLGVGLPVIPVGTTAFWFVFERPFVRKLSATSRRNPKVLPTRPLAAALVEDRRASQPAAS